MTNLLLNDSKTIAKSRNIKDYENKSYKDLLNLLSDKNTKIRIPKEKLK